MTRYALVLFVLFALPARALDQTSEPPPVTRTTLANGLRVVIVPNRLAPVVATHLTYLAGSNDAPPGFPGTAHAVEHMMFRGSEGLDRDQAAELSQLLGGAYNANTTETATNYTYLVPNTDLPLVLKSEALRMRGASITQADWEQERGAINQEVQRDLSSPTFLMFMQVQAALYQGSPYENDALGTRESFDKTDAALLRKFYDTWYAPNNAVLVIAGDVDPAQTVAQVQAAFGTIPSRLVPPHAAINAPTATAKIINLPTDSSVAFASISFRFPGMTAQDFTAADVLADVLGSQRGPLYALVPQGKALSAQFSYQAMKDAGVGMAMVSFPRAADPKPTLDAMRGVLTAIARDGADPAVVEASKQQEIAQLAFQADSISGLARAWGTALTVRGAQSPDELAQAYAAVTPADVSRLAQQLLDQSQAVTAVLTPEGAGRPPGTASFGAPEVLGSPPDHPVELPDWARSALTNLTPPATPTPAEVTMLSNGLRLIVLQTTVSPTVTVMGRVQSQDTLQEPAGQEGVAKLTDDLFEYGTVKRDRLALLEAVDALAATESAGRNFSLKILATKFEAGMALLAEHELQPAFPESAVATVRSQTAQALAGRSESPRYLTGRAVIRGLVPPADPTLREPTEASVGALTGEEVRQFYRAAYRPDLTTIVIVGDVTPARAQGVVAATFGGWKADGTTPALDLPSIPANPGAAARVPNSNSLQDQVTLAQTVALPVTSPDRYTLELGNAILGGGFSSRLYRDLRVRTGYVYSVSSGFDWERTRAAYFISYGADPGKADAARTLALRELHDMQTVPVSEPELLRARVQVLRRLALGRSSVGSIAGQYLRQVSLGLPLEPVAIASKRYLEITAAEIQQAFATYMRPDALTMVTQGPPVPANQ